MRAEFSFLKVKKEMKKRESPVIDWPFPVFWLVVFVSRDPEEGIYSAARGRPERLR